MGSVAATYDPPFMVAEGKWETVDDGMAVTTNTVQFDSSSSSTYSRQEAIENTMSSTVAHIITDDGDGGFVGGRGLINYSGKTIALKVVQDAQTSSYRSDSEGVSAWSDINNMDTKVSTPQAGGIGGGSSSTAGGNASARGGEYSNYSFKEVFGSSALLVSYKTGTPSDEEGSYSFKPPGTVIDLCPLSSDRIVPGSVQFQWMGHTYQDFEGRIYRGRTLSNPGVWSGDLDYFAGLAYMFDYVVDGAATDFTLQSLWTSKGRWNSAKVVGMTSMAPLRPGSFVFSVVDLAGNQIVATANNDGVILGDHCIGTIDVESGGFDIMFGDYVADDDLTDEEKAEDWYNAADVDEEGDIWRPWPVDPQTFRYNAISYFYLPLDADVIGLDPVRLPQDGRVPIFRPGTYAVVGHTEVIPAATYEDADEIDLGRTRLARVRLIGNDGVTITEGYTENLTTGKLVVTDSSEWAQPVTIETRVEDMVMVAEVFVTGELRFTRPLTHDYPAPGSYISSALIAGNIKARVSLVFDQLSWNNVWSDTPGTSATATFNDLVYPIEVVNGGALTERWVAVFTSSTTFNLIGEHVGLVATGSTSEDCAPLNPTTGLPYLKIPALGWGGGWANGNCLRINTIGGTKPVWAVLAVQQGPETEVDDDYQIINRGGVDRP